MITAYVTIGNSDDKLSQEDWAAFCDDVAVAVSDCARRGGQIHAACFSMPNVPWQNAVWALEAEQEPTIDLRLTLRRLAHRYRQDSIAWAQVNGGVEFLYPIAPPS
jgi:hypothetical protein